MENCLVDQMAEQMVDHLDGLMADNLVVRKVELTAV